MENTNPEGSVLTVRGAAQAFEGMLGSEEPQGQPEAPEAQETEETQEYEAAQDDEGEEYEEEVQETPKYRVKAGDEELEVDLDELVKGYSRTADYTRKTQALAEQRKAIEAEAQKVQEAVDEKPFNDSLKALLKLLSVSHGCVEGDDYIAQHRCVEVRLRRVGHGKGEHICRAIPVEIPAI